MKLFLKSLICVITAIVIFNFSIIQASAEITYEQEVLIYCLQSNSDYFEQGIPYLPSYFQGLFGWNNVKSLWTEFVNNSNYDNRCYYTRLLYSGNNKYFYIVNYDFIYKISGLYVYFNNCSVAYFCTSVNSTTGVETVNLQTYFYDDSSSTFFIQLNTNYSGWYEGYISFSLNGSNLLLDDTTMLYESLNENKDIGIKDLLKNILTGNGFSLMDNSLVDVNVDDFSLLGSLFGGDLSASLSASLGVGVEVGDDTYNEILTDIQNNTRSSSYWSQIDSSTQNNLQNTYNNLKSCFDNSMRVYQNDAGDYYYQATNSNYTDYITNNEGDTTTYYNTYIYNSSDDDNNDDNSNGGAYDNNSNGGAYANASVGNINNSVSQDINIDNVSSSSDEADSTSKEFDEDIDISTFISLLNKCSDFLVALKTAYTTLLPDEFVQVITVALLAVVICRFVGR